ncbi:MAG: insulinase family protein [Firmicutes bacterium]|nr:insulinase family protein [Bacillota bacterium]
MPSGFRTMHLSDGIDLHILVDRKFKTVGATAVVHAHISSETVTKNALLPRVLRRGTERIPETMDLERRLEELYGATLDVGVSKKGTRHLLAFHVEVAEARYVGAGSQLFRAAVELLRDVMLRPARGADGALRHDYVAQEKENLRRLIESLIDDKQAWAMRRCMEVMFPGDDAALFKYGRVEDIEGISPAELSSWHQELFGAAPIDIFVVGNCDEESVVNDVGEVFSLNRAVAKLPPAAGAAGTSQARDGEKVNTVVETMDVSQGHLVMGYRTGLRLGDADWPAMVVTDGVFGRYSHSKLFQVVREREALAYSVWSALDPTRGLMLVSAGVDFGAREKCVELVEGQLRAVKAGQVSAEELDNTLRGMARDFALMSDHPGSLVDFALEAKVNEVDLGVEDLKNAVAKVTLDGIVHAASRARLDTVYFLTHKEGPASEG